MWVVLDGVGEMVQQLSTWTSGVLRSQLNSSDGNYTGDSVKWSPVGTNDSGGHQCPATASGEESCDDSCSDSKAVVDNSSCNRTRDENRHSSLPSETVHLAQSDGPSSSAYCTSGKTCFCGKDNCAVIDVFDLQSWADFEGFGDDTYGERADGAVHSGGVRERKVSVNSVFKSQNVLQTVEEVLLVLEQQRHKNSSTDVNEDDDDGNSNGVGQNGNECSIERRGSGRRHSTKVNCEGQSSVKTNRTSRRNVSDKCVSVDSDDDNNNNNNGSSSECCESEEIIGKIADKIQSRQTSIEGGFKVDKELNRRLLFFEGDIGTLAVDAIVVFTNESFTTAESDCGKHFDTIDNSNNNITLPAHINEQLDPLGCGEAKLVQFYDIQQRNVIFSVGPRYVEKYHSAAETSLHSCYRECLRALVEHKLRSVAFPCFYHRRCENYPKEYAVHIVLRTLRRCMELLSDQIDNIVLCAPLTIGPSDEIYFYTAALPLYFPRNSEEELLSAKKILFDTDKFGDCHIANRRIPDTLFRGHEILDVMSMSESEMEETVNGDETKRQQHPKGEETIDPQIDVSFAVANLDMTQSEMRRIASQSDVFNFTNQTLSEDKMMYTRYYCAARQMSQTPIFSEIATYPFIYSAGKDHQGRNVIVFVAAMFPGYVDWYSLILYLIWKTDHIIEDKFTLLFLNAAFDKSSNFPTLRFLRELHQLIAIKYINTLDQIIFLHSSLSFKVLFNCYWALMPPQAKKTSIHYLKSLTELLEYLPDCHSSVPKFVKELG